MLNEFCTAELEDEGLFIVAGTFGDENRYEVLGCAVVPVGGGPKYPIGIGFVEVPPPPVVVPGVVEVPPPVEVLPGDTGVSTPVGAGVGVCFAAVCVTTSPSRASDSVVVTVDA